MYSVDRRNAATLLPIIEASIHPHTTIMSDSWAAYNNIGQMPRMGYTHLTVNHSQNFVDPITGANTQTIESHWSHAKQRNKRQRGTHRHMVESYLCEWMWRQRNKNAASLFDKILADIAQHWPPQ